MMTFVATIEKRRQPHTDRETRAVNAGENNQGAGTTAIQVRTTGQKGKKKAEKTRTGSKKKYKENSRGARLSK